MHVINITQGGFLLIEQVNEILKVKTLKVVISKNLMTKYLHFYDF